MCAAARGCGGSGGGGSAALLTPDTTPPFFFVAMVTWAPTKRPSHDTDASKCDVMQLCVKPPIARLLLSNTDVRDAARLPVRPARVRGGGVRPRHRPMCAVATRPWCASRRLVRPRAVAPPPDPLLSGWLDLPTSRHTACAGAPFLRIFMGFRVLLCRGEIPHVVACVHGVVDGAAASRAFRSRHVQWTDVCVALADGSALAHSTAAPSRVLQVLRDASHGAPRQVEEQALVVDGAALAGCVAGLERRTRDVQQLGHESEWQPTLVAITLPHLSGGAASCRVQVGGRPCARLAHDMRSPTSTRCSAFHESYQ